MRHAKYSINSVLDLLLYSGFLGNSQVDEIRASFKGGCNRFADPLDYVVGLNIPLVGKYSSSGRTIDDDIMAQLMAKEAAIPYRRVEQRDLDLELITNILPQNFARRNLVLPLGLENGHLMVGVRHPYYQTVLADVRRVVSYPTSPIIVPGNQIKKLIEDIYVFHGSVTGAEGLYSAGNSIFDINNLEQFVKLKSSTEIADDDQHVKNLLDHLLGEAVVGKASDIHLEPKRNHYLVRMRFDGVLHDIHRLPKVLHAAVTSRIKTMSRLDITEKRRPQDGRIKISTKTGEAEVRVSTVPMAFGEKTVMRILDPEAMFMDLSNMFFRSEDLDLWNSFSSSPHGIILVTGPTGSGKTTTLYSTLRQLSTEAVNITTVEDPIEMVQDEFNQIAVQTKVGITFGNIIRNILRQDPDIIMIGEMRDTDTADNAVQAALTGHLVLSTLHTNDAPSAITRLMDLGMQPFLVASTVIGIMAQRLVRRICRYCLEDLVLTPEVALATLELVIDQDVTIKTSTGCEMCRGTGYRGRLAAVEVMPITDGMRQLMSKKGATALEFKALARSEGMMTLRENALKIMLEGLTTSEEVLRVTASDTLYTS